MLGPSTLYGTWSLVDFRIAHSDGRSDVLPFGPTPQGLLLYTPDGHMAASLSRGQREALGVARLETSSKASAEAKAAAFDGYMSYAGRWELEGQTVVHHVLMAQTPELVGQTNRRTVSWDDADLVLSYEITAKSGVVRTFRLTWRRTDG